MRVFLYFIFNARVDPKVDYYFFRDPDMKHSVTAENVAAKLKELQVNHRPRPFPSPRRQQHPGALLQKTLKLHTDRSSLTDWIPIRGRRPRPISIFVLTSATWDPKHTETAIRTALLNYKKLKKYDGEGRAWAGIQFIRFGDDPVAQQKLNRLDGLNNVDEEHERARADIVDTEVWDGDFIKMLYGGIERGADDPVPADPPRQSTTDLFLKPGHGSKLLG